MAVERRTEGAKVVVRMVGEERVEKKVRCSDSFSSHAARLLRFGVRVELIACVTHRNWTQPVSSSSTALDGKTSLSSPFSFLPLPFFDSY